MAGTSLRRNPTTTSLITGLESTRDGTIAVRDGTGLRPQTFGVRLYQPRATSVNSGAFSSHLPLRVLVRQRPVAFHSFASRRYFRRSTGPSFSSFGYGRTAAWDGPPGQEATRWVAQAPSVVLHSAGRKRPGGLPKPPQSSYTLPSFHDGLRHPLHRSSPAEFERGSPTPVPARDLHHTTPLSLAEFERSTPAKSPCPETLHQTTPLSLV
jgi:hypothetical protein